MIFTEHINTERLQFCIDNYEHLVPIIQKHRRTNCFGSLDRLQTISSRTTDRIIYTQKNNGRYYGDKYSYQGLLREFRTFICDDIYVDIDIKSAHYAIFKGLCQKYDLDISFMGQIKFQVKTEEFRLLFNGDNFGYDNIQNTIYERFDTLKSFPEIQENVIDCSTKNNPEGSSLSLLLQYYENQIIQQAVIFFQELGYEIGGLFFDGLFVKNKFENISLILPDLELLILEKFGFSVEFKIKTHPNIIPLDGNFKKTVLRTVTERHDKYVRPTDLRFNTQSIIIEAGLGAGKSTAVRSFMNSNRDDYDRCIVLTPRISYAMGVLQDFNKTKFGPFTLYKNSKSFNIRTNVIIQAESLYRLNLIQHQRLLVIIDESEGLLSQLTSKDTHKQNHTKNIRMFELLLSNATKVVFLDAFISVSKKTLELCKTMKLPFKHFKYVRKRNERGITFRINKVPLDHGLYEDRFASDLIHLLQLGKKVFVFISSRYRANQVVNLVRKAGFHSIGTYWKDNKSTTLENVNEEWTGFDCVIVTSSITIGINFDTVYFDLGMVLVTQKSKNLIRDVFQAMYRVRTFKEHHFFGYFDFNGGIPEYMATEAYIKNDHINNLRDIVKNHYDLTGDSWTSKNEWVFNLCIQNELESRRSVVYLQDEFHTYLDVCNYKFSVTPYFKDNYNLVIDCFRQTEYPSINTIPDISLDEYKELIRKTTPTYEEVQIRQKFKFLNYVYDEPNDVVWGIYNRNPSIFTHLRHEIKYDTLGTISTLGKIKEIVRKSENRKIYLKALLNDLGLNQSWKPGITVEKTTIQHLYTNVITNPKKYLRLCQVFDVRINDDRKLETSKATVGFINSLLTKYSITKLKAVKKNGNIGYYELQINEGPDGDPTHYSHLDVSKIINYKKNDTLERLL